MQSLGGRLTNGRPEGRVDHPGLASHPDHALWQRDFSRASGLFAFALKPKPDRDAALSQMLDQLVLFGNGMTVSADQVHAAFMSALGVVRLSRCGSRARRDLERALYPMQHFRGFRQHNLPHPIGIITRIHNDKQSQVDAVLGSQTAHYFFEMHAHDSVDPPAEAGMGMHLKNCAADDVDGTCLPDRYTSKNALAPQKASALEG